MRTASGQAAAIHLTAEAAAREVWYLLSCGADPPSTTFVFLNFIRVRFKMPLNSVHSYAWRGVQSNAPTSPAKVYTPSEHFPMQ